MTSRMRSLAALALTLGLALSGSLFVPAEAEDSYDCSHLPDCSQNLCHIQPEPSGVFVIGPCDDGNGDLAYQTCAREGFYLCRQTS